MNHEDQTHKDHNEEETTKAPGTSNHEDQTQTTKIKPKLRRSNPNNKDRFQTMKIKPRRQRLQRQWRRRRL